MKAFSPKLEIRNPKLTSGAALMLALWALFMLSAMVTSWAVDIQSRLTLSSNANRVLSAEAMACSGADVALHPAISPSSPNLHRQIGSEGYDTHIAGEGGRLNLNWLTAGEDPVRLDILRRYLGAPGLPLRSASSDSSDRPRRQCECRNLRFRFAGASLASWGLWPDVAQRPRPNTPSLLRSKRGWHCWKE